MDKNKIVMPTTLGKFESEIIYSEEIPEDMFSLIDVKVDIHPVIVGSSFYYRKDPFIDMYINSEKELKIVFRLEYINTKKAEIVEDEEYYHLIISELVRVPKNKQIALRVTISTSLAKIIFPNKPNREKIIERARAEMANYQTRENPNADGRFPKGTIYNWGGSR